jgi:hypothetical protein
MTQNLYSIREGHRLLSAQFTSFPENGFIKPPRAFIRELSFLTEFTRSSAMERISPLSRVAIIFSL